MTEPIRRELSEIIQPIGLGFNKGTPVAILGLATVNLRTIRDLVRHHQENENLWPGTGLTEEEAKSLRDQIDEVSKKIVGLI